MLISKLIIGPNASSLRKIAKILRSKSSPSLGASISCIQTRGLSSTTEAPTEKRGLIDRLIGKESNVASPAFKSRWLMTIPAFFTHLCIGSPYAWSLVADIVTREAGFVAPAAADWTLMQAAFPLSIVLTTHGISASLFGNWQMRVGIRKALACAACSFGGGLLLGAVGIHFHSLPLLYAGYGLMGGAGMGMAYTPPIQTLIQWFPEKKGVASGLAIAGFGSGALIFTPAMQYLTKKFAKMPEYLGPAEDFVTKVIDGKLFAATVDGSLVEVVKAGAAEIAKLSYSLPEGLYAVGTGSTGAAEALAVMGLTYFTVLSAAALTIRNPHPSYKPPVVAATTTTAAVVEKPGPKLLPPDLTPEQVVRTPQFYLLGTTFFTLATGGMGLFSVAKPMMSEIFSSLLPAVVTSAFAAKFLLMLSGANLGGRLGWSAISDYIGRRNTVYIFILSSIPIYFSLPYFVQSVASTGETLPLYAFCGATMAALSAFGGIFAIMPAYEADLFGSKYVGAVHGRMLLFSSLASVLGPSLFMKLRSISEMNAIESLLAKISPEKFYEAFGTPMEQAYDLLATKTLTISKLLVLAPPGTLDPTPHLYDTTMYSISGLMAISFIAHSLVKPIPPTVIDVKPIESTVTNDTPATSPASEQPK